MIVNERIETYINSLGTNFPGYLLDVEKEALENDVPIIRKSMQEFIKYQMVTVNPKNILEIGTAVGFSALLMHEYAREAKITTIENYPPRIKKAKENFENFARKDTITLIEGDALEVLPQLKDKFDFIFIDAAKGQYMNYMEIILKQLEVGGILLSDNVLQDGDIIESRYAVTRRNRTIHSRMREYLYFLKHDDRLETLVLPVGDGITISKKIKMEDAHE